MPKIGALRIDTKTANEGRWVEYPEVPGMRFKIARYGNAAFKRAVDKIMRPVRSVVSTMSTERLTEMQWPAVARHVLVGWDGIEDDDGNEIPYSPQKAEEFLRDERYAALTEWVLAESRNDAAITESEVKAAAGNL